MLTRGATLVVPARLHEKLHAHLFPGDALEAAALLLCAPMRGRRLKLLARDMIAVPYSACERECSLITWPGEYVESAIDRAQAEGLCIIAVHSHPRGCYGFSEIDNVSDGQLVLSLREAVRGEHGTAVMVPGGEMIARIYGQSGNPIAVDLVTVPGHDISLWWQRGATSDGPQRTPMAFGSEMTQTLKRMSACVIGVSGTGSIIAEQIARLGFGEIVLIDFDKMEGRNLNRILNSTLKSTDDQVSKVEMFATAIRSYRSDCEIIQVPESILSLDAIIEASQADVLFSCVDTAEGRHLADRIASFFAIPLFDIGVSIPTRDNGEGERAIAEVCGRIDYVFPGGSNLLDRHVYDAAMLESEYLRQSSPTAHRLKLEEGYLRDTQEQAPAVVSLNMRASAVCMMEFLARTFPYRHFSNCHRARTLFLLADGEEEYFAEDHFVAKSSYPVAMGITEPMLGLPILSNRRRAA